MIRLELAIEHAAFKEVSKHSGVVDVGEHIIYAHEKCDRHLFDLLYINQRRLFLAVLLQVQPLAIIEILKIAAIY